MTSEKNITKQTSTGRTVSFDPETKTVTILKDGAPVYHSHELQEERNISDSRYVGRAHYCYTIDGVLYEYLGSGCESEYDPCEKDSDMVANLIKRHSAPVREYYFKNDYPGDVYPLRFHIYATKANDGGCVSEQEKEHLKRVMELYCIELHVDGNWRYLMKNEQE